MNENHTITLQDKKGNAGACIDADYFFPGSVYVGAGNSFVK